MLVTYLKSKIHPLSVTDSNLNYEGSLTLDSGLMELADLGEFEKVLVVDINNGNRFETYIIKGKKGSGEVCVNGGAARLTHIGDQVIIMSFVMLEKEEVTGHKPVKILVSPANKPL